MNVVGDEYGCFVETAAQGEELILQLQAGYRIDGPEGFVKKEQLRIGCHGSSDTDALSLPAGEFPRTAMEELLRVESDLFEEFGGALQDALGRPTLEARDEAHVLANGVVREEADFLDYITDAAPQGDQIPLGGCAAVDADFAAGGEEQAVYHLQGGGFSGAAASQQDKRLTVLNSEA